MEDEEIENKIPSTLLACKTIQNQESLWPMKVLLDSGGPATLIHERCLLPGATPSLLPGGKTNFQTTAGLFSATGQVFLDQIILPEFDKTKRISGNSAYVFNSPCKYDMIVGRDILNKIGLTLCFAEKTMWWIDYTVPMKTDDFLNTPLS